MTRTYTSTPGPWRVEERFTERQVIVVADTGEWTSVVVAAGGQSSVEQLANARLIAAAPDLLKALKNALVELEVNGDSIGAVVDVLESEGRAALAKAKGR